MFLWLVAAALAAAMLATPQPVDPWEMPSLVLDRAAASNAIELDETLSKEAPDSEEARALRTLFLDHGRAEANPPYESRDYDRRQAAIHRATEALIEEHGAQAFEAMRVSAVEEFMRVFDEAPAEVRNETQQGVIGGFAEVLEQYGAVLEGQLVAPPLTIRALYKARWNSIHRRNFVEGFSRIELQAYWGWLALHGWGKPLEQREAALLAFRDAGGFGTAETQALFDVLGGQSERAVASLNQLYEETGQLRLRNFSRAVLQTALLRAASP